MISDTASALHRNGFRIKMKESVVLCGMGIDQPPSFVEVPTHGQGVLQFPVVEEAVLLGTMLTRAGDTVASWDHRFLKAEGNAGKIYRRLHNPSASWEGKVRAFSRGPTTSLLYDCASWVPTQERLQQARARGSRLL